MEATSSKKTLNSTCITIWLITTISTLIDKNDACFRMKRAEATQLAWLLVKIAYDMDYQITPKKWMESDRHDQPVTN